MIKAVKKKARTVGNHGRPESSTIEKPIQYDEEEKVSTLFDNQNSLVTLVNIVLAYAVCS